MKIEAGDIVCDQYGCTGQVTREYASFWDVPYEVIRDPKGWLEAQTVPFTEHQINNERWFSIGLFDGGSCVCCESKMEFVERIDINSELNTEEKQ